MAQYLRPIDDSGSIGKWIDDKGDNHDIYTALDDVISNDGTYITSVNGISGCKYRCQLNLSVLPVDGPHIIKFRVKRTSGDGNTSITCSLYSLGQLISTSGPYPANHKWMQYSYTLSDVEIEQISNYTSLYLELEIESSDGTNNVGLSWLEFEIPDGYSDIISSKGMNMRKEDYEKYKNQIKDSMPSIKSGIGPKAILDVNSGHVYQAQDSSGEWWTLKGTCNRCGECCDHNLVEGYEDDKWKCNFMRVPGGKTDKFASALYSEVVNDKVVYGCQLNFSKPWGCKIYPSDPEEKLFPSCSYSWERS